MPQEKITIYLPNPIRTTDAYLEKLELTIGSANTATHSFFTGDERGKKIWEFIISKSKLAAEWKIRNDQNWGARNCRKYFSSNWCL